MNRDFRFHTQFEQVDGYLVRPVPAALVLVQGDRRIGRGACGGTVGNVLPIGGAGRLQRSCRTPRKRYKKRAGV